MLLSEDALHFIEQAIDGDRLGDVTRRLNGRRFPASVAIRCDGDYRDGRERRHLLLLLVELPPVHHRHHHVEQDQIRMPIVWRRSSARPRCRQRRCGICGFEDSATNCPRSGSSSTTRMNFAIERGFPRTDLQCRPQGPSSPCASFREWWPLGRSIERRSGSGLALDANRPAVRLDELTRNVETESQPTECARRDGLLVTVGRSSPRPRERCLSRDRQRPGVL